MNDPDERCRQYKRFHGMERQTEAFIAYLCHIIYSIELSLQVASPFSGKPNFQQLCLELWCKRVSGVFVNLHVDAHH